MKKYLLGAAAALAIVAPGVASAQSAYVDLGYQSGEIDAGGPSDDYDGWTVGGAAAFGGAGTVGFQVDGVVGNTELDSGGEVDYYTLGGHAFSRNENFLVGGFANLGNNDAGSGAEFDYWSAGLEGQYYLSRTTLDGALAYSQADDNNDTELTIDLGATHFVTDNFSVGAGVGFGTIDDGTDEADTTDYGLNTEYQFSAVPISLFGGWSHLEIDDTDVETDTLSVGVRYNFGGSLFERNRSGASLSRTRGFARYSGLL